MSDRSKPPSDDQLDDALADTFPASDPVALEEPHTHPVRDREPQPAPKPAAADPAPGEARDR